MENLFLVMSILPSVCFLYLYGYVLPLFGNVYFYALAEDMFYSTYMNYFSSMHIIWRLELFMLLIFHVCSFSDFSLLIFYIRYFTDQICLLYLQVLVVSYPLVRLSLVPFLTRTLNILIPISFLLEFSSIFLSLY